MLDNDFATFTHRTLMVSLSCLILVRLARIIFFNHSSSLSFLSFLMTCLLTIFLFATWKRSIRASLWLSFVITLPFTTGVLNFFDPRTTTIGLVESISSAIVFTSAMFFARYEIKTDKNNSLQKEY